MSRKEKKGYIEEFNEIQNKLLLPGYYTGGRTPKWLLYPPANKKLFAIVMVSQMIFVILMPMLFFLYYGLSSRDIRLILIALLFFIILVLFILYTVRKLHMKNK